MEINYNTMDTPHYTFTCEPEAAETPEDIAFALEHIAKLILEGYSAGVDPTWKITGYK